jgi:predicted Zn-dependent peptidase
MAFSQEKSKEFRSSAPKPGPAPKITLGEFSQFELDNGLKVIVVENHKIPRVSFQVLLDRQPFREGDIAGYASMSGQLMMHGTENRTKDEIDLAVDFIGASLSSSSTSLFGSALTKHQESLLEIMTDVLYNPTFPEEEFDKVKTQTLSGLQANKTDANAIASNVSTIINYGPEHPYGEIVTEETVNNISVDDVKSYYEKYWMPNQSYLAIVGDISEKEARKLAEKYFGQWEPGEMDMKNIDMPPMPEQNRVCFVDKAGAVQSVIRITYPVDLNYNSEDRIPATVMNNILGGGVFSGYLMQNLREDKGYTYGARSSLSPDKYVANFNAYASVRNEVTDSSVTEFLYEMNRLRNEPVDADHLQLVKNSMTGQFARSLESPNTLANMVLSIARYDLPEDYYETYLEKVNAVTIEDISRVAGKYIRPNAANIIVVGNKDEVAEKLEPFDADSNVEFFDVYGNPIEAVGVNIPEGLTAEQVIEDYLTAIGGREKLESVEDQKWVMAMNVIGQSISADMSRKKGGKLLFEMKMEDNVMQKQVLNGDEGYVEQMGQRQVLEGEDLANLKAEAMIFKELSYGNDDYKLELKGIEKVEDANAYKIVVTNPAGNTITEYYDIETNLKIRDVTTQEGQGQTVTTINDYQDYSEVDGILLPHTIVLTGLMPVPLKQETQSIEFNTGIEDEMFEMD